MKAKRIWFEKGRIYLTVDDGRTASLPLKSFPRLYNATEAERLDYTLSPFGIHWEKLDEDLSFEGFFHEDQKTQSELGFVFDSLPEINVNQLARVMGINQSLMAKYICGAATPSESRKQEIEDALHRLGDELKAVVL